MLTVICLLIGFIFLIKGADLFVDGSSSIARKFNIPSMIIGLTIVAMGTSAPEASVSITSALSGLNDICVANVVGSNFFNILIVLGLSATISNLPVEKNTIKIDMPLLLLTCILTIIFGVDMTFSRIESIIFLTIFVLFIVNSIKIAKQEPSEDVEEKEDKSMFKILMLTVIGIVGIVWGGDIVVDAATKIATMFGMSENLIGLTIVAVGTSLPELVTSVVATRKGETDIAIGNVIGSNIFNILFVLGMSMLINPINITSIVMIDILFMTIISVLLIMITKSKNKLTRTDGVMFIIIYLIYMIYTIMR